MPAFIGARIERYPRGGSTSRNRMGGNARSASPRWKTKSSSARWWKCSMQSGTRLGWRDCPILHHPGFQPFANQADHPRVAHSMLHETDQPILAEPIEKGSNVGVQNPVHLPTGDRRRKRIQRIVLATLGSEPVREPKEVFFAARRSRLTLVGERLPPLRLRP